jgi:hypothetical protein
MAMIHMQSDAAVLSARIEKITSVSETASKSER